jgi:PTH1 family peptidyl-tRNA hydrolase
MNAGGNRFMADTPLLIAGLGNPGSQYAKNRHNAGFIVVDELHAHHKFGPWKAKFDGLLSEGTLGGRKTYLLKPQTFMNLSGASVGPALRFFKLPLQALVVIHDEIDLAAGKLKVKTGGGDAGQNGLRSITATLGPDYRRVRLGIGHPGEKHRVSGHVLDNFSKDDILWLKPLVMAMVEAAPLLAKDDDAGFMSKVAILLKPPANSKKPDSKKKDDA